MGYVGVNSLRRDKFRYNEEGSNVRARCKSTKLIAVRRVLMMRANDMASKGRVIST